MKKKLTPCRIVFLDLPSPWLAIANAVAVLRRDKQTRICCFSPCIEQVQRTLTEMIVHNFVDLELFECLALPLETEFLTISTPPSFRGNPEHLNELDAQVTPESTEDASKNNILLNNKGNTSVIQVE